MIVLVCGGREFNDHKSLWDKLNIMHEEVEITEIVHGGCRGADTLAGQWAKTSGVQEHIFHPNYLIKDPKKAPLIRNSDMAAYLAYRRDKDEYAVVLACPGGPGTRHMVTQATKREIEVIDL